MTKEINNASLADFHNNLKQDVSRNVLQNAVAQVGIFNAAQNVQAKTILNPTFSIEVSTGKVSDQKRSGRCWLFSSLTNLRTEFAKRYNIKDFELSQNYLSFYDRLEKANYFYSNIIDTADLPLDDRKVNFILASPNSDGGQWQYGTNLIQKYGVVPDYVMPETIASENTSEFNATLGTLLRKHAIELREMVSNNQDTEQRVSEMLNDVYRLCVYSFGQPPREFELSLKDDSGKIIEADAITPLDFLNNYFTTNLDDYVCLMNSPQSSKKYNQAYTIDLQGNIIGGMPEKFLNLPIERLKEMTIQQLRANDTVWFGNDVGNQSERRKGYLLGDMYQYDQLFGIDTKMTKAQALDYSDSAVTHAMVFTGVNLKQDQPNRWKVENSWGEKNGQQGYFTMDDHWFDDNVYEVVINKKFLTAEELNTFEAEPILLPAWDAME